MKKLHGLILAMCLAVMPALQSCDDNDGKSIGDFTPPLWATVRVTGNAFYLNSDVWGTLWPVNTDLGWYEAADGQRVITVFTPLSDGYAGYDYAVKLLRLQNVLTKTVETLTPENEKEFGNDPISIYKGNIGVGGGYMNIVFNQNLPSEKKHRISLVRAQDAATSNVPDDYIHLELRYNNYGDLTGYRRSGVVSFNLADLNITSQTKGIKVKLNSEVNGEVELTIDLKSAVADQANVQDLDLSEIKLK